MSLLTVSQRLPSRVENPRRTASHPVAREELSSILRALECVQVVGEAADGEEACELYDQHSPDVLLVDLRIPEKDGLQVVTGLMSGLASKPRIILITTYESEEDIRGAIINKSSKPPRRQSTR
jgi:DNA-binding NarL/FixJ family response regulator